MIRLTRLNNQPLAINADLIKFVESAPDTTITLVNNEKVIVRETTEEVIQRVLAFRRAILAELGGVGFTLNSPAPPMAGGSNPTRNPSAKDESRG